MEQIMAEAKRAITECDAQLHRRNSSSEEFFTDSTVNRPNQLSTPPTRSVKSPTQGKSDQRKDKPKQKSPRREKKQA